MSVFSKMAETLKQSKVQFTVVFSDIALWASGWSYFIVKKLRTIGIWFEDKKDSIVDILLARRGAYQRPFLHFTLLILFFAGMVSAPILADTYPRSDQQELKSFTPPSANEISLDLSSYGVETKVSEKPRDRVEEYVVKEGDTLASIAGIFNVSIDTIKWVNTLTTDKLNLNQKLKVPPVTGIVHKVKEGETVYSIATKYKAEAQNIVNFPFNDFVDLDSFALRTGQTLIVPDGVMPQAPAIKRPVGPPINLASGNGKLLWPTGGTLTQYSTWYHTAIDIANNTAPGIASADSGSVVLVQYLKYGYGHHVMIDHGNGLVTLYGHMTDIYVQLGDRVSRGQIIGRMGSTGRSTGTHLHFEVRDNGRLQNPLPYLK